VGVKECTPVIVEKCFKAQSRVGCTVNKCCKYEKKDGIVTLIKCVDGKEECKLVPCTCPLKSCQCSQDVVPVCADNKTYQNECVARCAGSTTIIKGRCAVAPPSDPTPEPSICKYEFFTRSGDKCSPTKESSTCIAE
jgi:hypothetical protein